MGATYRNDVRAPRSKVRNGGAACRGPGAAATAALFAMVTAGGAAFADTHRPAVDVVATGDGNGWWVINADGTLQTFGSATELMLTHDDGLNGDVVAAAGTRDGRGLHLLTDDARLHTAYPAPEAWVPNPENWVPQPENWLPVDVAATPSGNGLWMLDASGAVFTAGDAGDAGHHGHPNPINWDAIGLAPTSSGHGYWIATEGGDVEAFGDADREVGKPDFGKIWDPGPN